jgi:hypothetical protein
MSHFYGITRGCARTEATRRGTAKSGLETVAASWEGAVKVTLYERDGRDYARIGFITWHGAGRDLTLYDGPVSGSGAMDYVTALKRAAGVPCAD